MLKALARVDRASETAFFAHLRSRIKGAILDALRAEDWAPRSLRRRGRAIQHTISDLQRRGLEPTAHAVAEVIGTTPEQVTGTLTEIHHCSIGSLHETLPGSEDLLVNHVADERSADALETLLRREDVTLITELLDQLPERERLVLKLSFYEELSNRQIGRVLSLSESRVSQLRSRALGRLRSNRL